MEDVKGKDVVMEIRELHLFRPKAQPIPYSGGQPPAQRFLIVEEGVTDEGVGSEIEVKHKVRSSGGRGK